MCELKSSPTLTKTFTDWMPFRKVKALMVVETDESKFCVACRDVERSVPEDYHDWHADRTAVVHL